MCGGDIVHVYVRNAGGRLIPIAERSAGLRQFIALLAFVESKAAGENVILLVDEAESHMHYDAQADLVRVFSEQTVVEKVIYSTHSAGCLPLDLGTGVRVIEPVGPADKPAEDWEHSRIQDEFSAFAREPDGVELGRPVLGWRALGAAVFIDREAGGEGPRPRR